MKKINKQKSILFTAITAIAILGLSSASQVGGSVKQNPSLNSINQQSETTSKSVHNQEIVDLAMNNQETFVIFDDIDGSQSLMHWGTTNGYQKAQKLDIPLEEGDKLTAVYADWSVAFIVVEKANGTNSIYGYGDNSKNQITQDGVTGYTTPVLVKEGIHLSDITINQQTTSIYYQEGSDLKILSQGINYYLGLGVSDKNLTISEKTIANSKLVNADAGIAHVAAILDFEDNSKDGVYAWGKNGNGQIGNGTFISENNSSDPNAITGVLPTKVDGIEDATEIYVGGNNTFATAPNGNGEKIYGWGAGMDGQLGAGSLTQLSPFELTELEELINGHDNGTPWSVIQIQSVNLGSTLLVDRGNKVERYVWGYQKNGQLGDGYVGEGDGNQIDFTFVDEVKQGGKSVTRDQLVAFDGTSYPGTGGTILSAWDVDGFDSIGGYGANINGALSSTGGNQHIATPIEIYEESQVIANGVSNEGSMTQTKFKFDLSIDSNIIDPASFNFAIKQEGELIDNNNVKVTGIQRNQTEDTVVSFEVTTETTAEENVGKAIKYMVSVDGGKSFGNEFTISYEALPADIATLKKWDYTATKHTATINYELDVPKGNPVKEDSFASKVEIYDSSNHMIGSDEAKDGVSLEKGSIFIDKTFNGDPLAAADTNKWKMRVYGDKYDDTKYTNEDIEVSTEPLDDALGPKFDTLKTDWIGTTKHESTLDYSFDTDFNQKNNTHYMDNENSTIESVTVTTDNTSLPITAIPTDVVTKEHDVDDKTGNGIRTHTGTVKLEGLEPEQVYKDLVLSVKWKSDSWTESKISTTPLPELTTSDWGAPAAPTVNLSEDAKQTTPEGFTVNGTFDTKDYDPAEQWPAKIDSIDLMYSVKGDEGNAIKAATKDFEKETTEWSGSYSISGLKDKTEYSVWTEVTYSAIGSEAFNGLKSTSDKITITTGEYDDVLISDFAWTPNTAKPSEGQFDIKVTSGHVGDNWYDPTFDPETIMVKDKGEDLNVEYVTSGKTEGTYTFSLTGLQGEQEYKGVKISLSNSNELTVDFTTSNLLDAIAPDIKKPELVSTTQTSAKINYSFTANSGDPKDYEATVVEKVELIDSTTSDILLTADNTDWDGTFNLINLEIEKDYKVKVRVTYSGNHEAESEELTFKTNDFNPAQPPVISKLEENKNDTTQTSISAHYKIDVPNEQGYHPTTIKSITAQLDDSNDKTIDVNKLDGNVVFDKLEGGTTYKVKLIIEWDDSVIPLENPEAVVSEIEITTKDKDDAAAPTIDSLDATDITQVSAKINYSITIPQGSSTVEPTELSKVVLLINGEVRNTETNLTPTDGKLAGSFDVDKLKAEVEYTATLNVYYLNKIGGSEVDTPVTKEITFKTLDKDISGTPTVSLSQNYLGSSEARFKADVELPVHDDNVYDVKMASYSIMKGKLEVSSVSLNANDFPMGETTSFDFIISGLSEAKFYNDFSIVINYQNEKNEAQTPITTVIPEFTTASSDDIIVTKSMINEQQLILDLDTQGNGIDSFELTGINSKGEETSIDYEITSKDEYNMFNIKLTLNLNLDDEYKGLSVKINDNTKELKLVDVNGNTVDSIGEIKDNSINEIENSSTIIIGLMAILLVATLTIKTGDKINLLTKK